MKMKSDLNRKVLLSSNLLMGKDSVKLDGAIAACNGHFNVIHPGHHRFLHFVKENSTYLAVLVLGDHLLTKDPTRHFYPEQDRANAVASLEIVDIVILLDKGSLNEIIRLIRPKVYSFGREFEIDRRSEIIETIQTLEQIGAHVIFGAGDISYSRSDLFKERTVARVSEERLNQFNSICKRNDISIEKLKGQIDQFRNKRILVVGDSIVDHFVACDAIGMSAEAPVLAVKEIEKKSFIGGAAIVASHITSLGAHCTYLSVVGKDEPGVFLEEGLLKNGVKPVLYIDDERPTTFKIRYMVDNQKLLRVSRLHESHIPREMESRIIESLPSLIKDIDGIIISDFVYGVITPAILDAITILAKDSGKMLFGDLQCSSQIGNVTKFKHFDLITPTEREARIALSDQDSGIENLATNLLSNAKCKNLMITVGANGVVAYQGNANNEIIASDHYPALISNPVDVAGAGDAMLSASALALVSGLNLMEAAVIGSFASAIAVNRIGNIPIQYEELNVFMEEMIVQISYSRG
jgi:rfaE bifunctional protein kinase chain/domain